MNELQIREKDLLRQLEKARQEYNDSSRATASGGPTANQAAIRERITSLEGELADVRAAIQGGEQIDHEKQGDIARKQRVRLLNDAATMIERRSALASELVELIEEIGNAYAEFVKVANDARHIALNADRSKRTYEAVDQALGVRQGMDQMLAGLFHIAGLGPVMREPGEMWASDIRNGASFVDINYQRATRATTAVRHQIEQETSNAETPLSSRRSPASLAR